MTKVIKKVKITKIEEWVPLFGFCKGFVVVKRGCGKIGGAKGRSAILSKKCDSILNRVEALVVFDELK